MTQISPTPPLCGSPPPLLSPTLRLTLWDRCWATLLSFRAASTVSRPPVRAQGVLVVYVYVRMCICVSHVYVSVRVLCEYMCPSTHVHALSRVFPIVLCCILCGCVCYVWNNVSYQLYASDRCGCIGSGSKHHARLQRHIVDLVNARAAPCPAHRLCLICVGRQTRTQ